MYLLNLIKNNKKISSCLSVLLIFAGVAFSYQYIFQTYFAMDEWSFWMQYIRYGPFHTILSTPILGWFTGGLRLGLLLTNDIFFSLFGLSILPWNITFLTLHFLNIFLLYKVLRKFKLSPFGSFLASFYFAVASAGQEALSWPAAGMQVLGTTPFILIAILLTIKFNDSRKIKFLLLAIFSAYLSFLMRPTGIMTPALIIALIFLFYKRSYLFRIPRIVIILGISTFFLGLCRLLIEYSDKLSHLVLAMFNIIFFPFVSLSHIFIPYRLMFRLSYGFINFYYPLVSKDSNVETISHLIVSDYLSIVVSIFILILIYILYRRVSKFNKKVITFGLIVFFVQYTVIALYYVDRGGLSYLASRHTYTSLIGISIIFGVLIDFILPKFKASKSLKRYLYICLFILVGVWLYKEMTVTRREVRAQALDDTAIKKTWESLQSLTLPNSKKVIFYVESDRTYYYPTYHLPFKLPAAYMLSLAFYGKPFIDRGVIGDIQSNNTYINSNNTQYGYFTDIKSLTLLIKQGKININNVVGLYFVDGTYTFKNTTKQTRKIIENELK